MKNLFILFVFLASSCISMKQNNYDFLKNNSYLWKNRKEALVHYSINLNKINEYYLIETYYVTSGAYWGCFYIGNKEFCFNRHHYSDSISYKKFKYSKFLVNSLKNGNIDSLVKLSKSRKYAILSPAIFKYFTIYKNRKYKYFKLREFRIKPVSSEKEFLLKLKKEL